MISVIIPLFNKALTIKRTIETVLSQTYRDYEIVVVDDGSTDGSFEIVRDLNIPGLRLIRQVNSGVSAARNKGIEEARGEYIALLDAMMSGIQDILNRNTDWHVLIRRLPFLRRIINSGTCMVMSRER